MTVPVPGPRGAREAGAPDAARLGRLLWRCRRGMKELDLLLESFARRTLPRSPKHDWDTFERLLTLPDPLLADYLLAGVVPQEAVLADLVTQVRQGLNFYSGLQSIPGGSAR